MLNYEFFIGAYIFDVGETLYLYIGRKIHPDFLRDVLG